MSRKIFPMILAFGATVALGGGGYLLATGKGLDDILGRSKSKGETAPAATPADMLKAEGAGKATDASKAGPSPLPTEAATTPAEVVPEHAEGTASMPEVEGASAMTDAPAATSEASGAESAESAAQSIAGSPEGNQGAPDALALGKNPVKNAPRVERYNDDESQLEIQDLAGHKPAFFRGSKIEEGAGRDEVIKYVYLSRGAWMLKEFQPYVDRIGIEVIKADTAEIIANYVEVSRSLNYLAALIANDDGTERMSRKIAKAVSLHREAVSALRIHWSRKTESVTRLLDEYIAVTFHKKVDPKAIRIPAGSLSGSQYRSYKDTYKQELEAKDEGGDDVFPPLRNAGADRR